MASPTLAQQAGVGSWALCRKCSGAYHKSSVRRHERDCRGMLRPGTPAGQALPMHSLALPTAITAGAVAACPPDAGYRSYPVVTAKRTSVPAPSLGPGKLRRTVTQDARSGHMSQWLTIQTTPVVTVAAVQTSGPCIASATQPPEEPLVPVAVVTPRRPPQWSTVVLPEGQSVSPDVTRDLARSHCMVCTGCGGTMSNTAAFTRHKLSHAHLSRVGAETDDSMLIPVPTPPACNAAVLTQRRTGVPVLDKDQCQLHSDVYTSARPSRCLPSDSPAQEKFRFSTSRPTDPDHAPISIGPSTSTKKMEGMTRSACLCGAGPHSPMHVCRHAQQLWRAVFWGVCESFGLVRLRSRR